MHFFDQEEIPLAGDQWSTRIFHSCKISCHCADQFCARFQAINCPFFQQAPSCNFVSHCCRWNVKNVILHFDLVHAGFIIFSISLKNINYSFHACSRVHVNSICAWRYLNVAWIYGFLATLRFLAFKAIKNGKGVVIKQIHMENFPMWTAKMHRCMPIDEICRKQREGVLPAFGWMLFSKVWRRKSPASRQKEARMFPLLRVWFTID